jgi:hypothetical protein
MLQGLVDRNPFRSPHPRSYAAPDRIVCYAQRTRLLKCSAPFEFHTSRSLVRTAEHEIAGSVLFDSSMAHRRETLDDSRVETIAISVQNRAWYTYQFSSPWLDFPEYISLGEMYGCSCSTRKADRAEEHYVECPGHPNFDDAILDDRLHDYHHAGGSYEVPRAFAHFHHLLSLVYVDTDGRLLRDLNNPPALNVMMIAPRPRDNGLGKVYERLGLDQIY